MPSNTEAKYDAVGTCSFGENGVSVCYDEMYEQGTDAEGGEVGYTMGSYVWTGDGRKEAPQE
ncbi:MAG: hypothetical protein MJZ28_05105 [Paludibacteraceae bacterium]|nr:hypothetical protein [Paludibacteraceae bacterium]